MTIFFVVFGKFLLTLQKRWIQLAVFLQVRAHTRAASPRCTCFVTDKLRAENMYLLSKRRNTREIGAIGVEYLSSTKLR